MRTKENYNQKLLVEGNDDQHVLWALCEKHSLEENFDVIDCEGITNLLDFLPVRFKSAGIKTIGIIIDADTNLKTRWEQVKARLTECGFIVPNDIPVTGLILTNETQKTGVWIMPNNNANGMLEDFISFLISEEDALLDVAHTTLEDIETRQLNKYGMVHKPKALIHTWLAWQEDPGTPMGQSITKKYLNTDQEPCLAFINWLTELFSE